MKKVIKIVLVTLALLIAYQVFLWLVPAKAVLVNNSDRVQDFVYSQQQYDAVMVGSSLGGRLKDTRWAEGNIYDLAMAFTNANTGLFLLQKTGVVPSKLFIEINSINYGADTSLLNGVFEAPQYQLNRWMPVTRRRNKFFPNILERLHASPAVFSNTPVKEDFFQKMLPEYEPRWMQISDTAYINQQFNMVLTGAQALQAAGSTIYLFELPMEPRITSSPLMQYHRWFFMHAARQYGFHFIPIDSSRNYVTTDGLHLRSSDAVAYAAYLFRQAKRDGTE